MPLSMSLPARHDDRARERFVCRKRLSKGEKCFRDQVAYFQQIHEITQQFNHSGWEKHGHLDTKIQANLC